MNEKDILLSFLGKALNLNSEEATELLYQPEPNDKGESVLKPNALDALLQKNSDKIASLKGDEKKLRDEGYQRAQKEIFSKLESGIKSKYNFESDLKGQELIDELISTKVAEAAKSGEITDDKIKTHPLYRELEKSKSKEIEELTGLKDKEIADVHSKYNLEKAVSIAKEKAKQTFLALNPVLSEDETIRANQIEDFVQRFSNENYQIEQDGSILMIDKEGKRKEDEHGNAVKFDEYVKANASKLFTFKAQGATSGTGASGSGSGSSGGQIVAPKNAEEYQKMFNEAKTIEDRATITKVWLETQKPK